MLETQPRHSIKKSVWRKFLEYFQGLKVSQKLMLISVFFVMPDSLMLYFFITGINTNIEFAEQEKKGNEYQIPLEGLLEYLPQHTMLAKRGLEGSNRELLIKKATQIDKVFNDLQEVDARIGKDLQFTDEGLIKRKREHYRVETVRREWENLKKNLSRFSQGEIYEQHRHLIADVRAMITHAGDLSNLILDPDLDSYYLMDATLLALPQTQDRFSIVITNGMSVLENTGTAKEREDLVIHASILKEGDLDRIVGSLQTALNEDPNFYGVSETLQSRLPPVLKNYRDLTEKFITQTKAIANGSRVISTEDYVKLGNEARDASFQLWRVAEEELNQLLQMRIESYTWRRTRSLLVAAMAALAAWGFVTFITRSISGPLRAQALDLQQTNEALQGEIAERKRAETELRRSEGHLAAAQEIARIGSWEWDVLAKKMNWSDENFRIHGFEPKELEVTFEVVMSCIHPEDRKNSDHIFQTAIAEGKSFAFEQRIVLRDSTERIIYQRGTVLKNEEGEVTEVFGTAQDITERKQAEEKIRKVHQELVMVSRQAGMAEVATGVLHNVGNVLNSVNVSASLISDRLTKSRVSHLTSACKLMREHDTNLGNFFSKDPRGSKLPVFLYTLADRLANEQAEMLREAEGLAKNIAHIKDIVAVQQNYAKVFGAVELVSVQSLVEDALEMNFAGLNRHGVQVIRKFSNVQPVRLDKHKALQILVNIIGNAKYAVSESNRRIKKITLKINQTRIGGVTISVVDNGVGIEKENLARIFAHGFTTKKDGHGFGLHSAALAATEMKGSLAVKSGGRGKGATFTLTLPITYESKSDVEEVILV